MVSRRSRLYGNAHRTRSNHRCDRDDATPKVRANRGGPRRNRPSLIHVIRVTTIEKLTEPVPLQARLAGLLLLPTINVPNDPLIVVDSFKSGGHCAGIRTPDRENDPQVLRNGLK